MDKSFPPVRMDFQDPNLAKLSDIASKDEVDVSEALRVIANVLISMEGYTLREVRSRLAKFERWQIDFTRDFDRFQQGIEEARTERTKLEFEQAQLIVNRSGKLSTSQKIKTALDARKVDWSAWWRDVLKSVTGFVFGGITMAIVLYILQNVFGK